jgi:DNA polymerase III subunit delta'
MSSNSQFDQAWEGVEAGWNNGKLAHAYLLQGAPHGAALRFTDKLLNLIYDDHPQVQTRVHPDLAWIEPQSKSRQILIDQIREQLIRPFSQTAFSGGWKVGVILCADRMNVQAANALLKTLEEPPAKSLLLLITDEPQSLLPTISSRCQRIALTAEDDEMAKHWQEPLLDILRELPPANPPAATLLTGRLIVLLNDLKKEFENEEAERIPEVLPAKEAKALLDGRSSARLIEARAEILRIMMRWQRDVLMLVLEQEVSTLYFPSEQEALERQSKICTRAEALKRISAIDETSRRLDRNLPAEMVFDDYFGQLLPS